MRKHLARRRRLTLFGLVCGWCTKVRTLTRSQGRQLAVGRDVRVWCAYERRNRRHVVAWAE